MGSLSSIAPLIALLILCCNAREYHIDPGVWKLRHAEVCAFLTASIDGGTLPDPLCANLDVHLDDWSQLAYAKMRQQLIASGNFRVDFQTVRESHGQLLAHPRLFCIHLQNSRVDPRAILEC